MEKVQPNQVQEKTQWTRSQQQFLEIIQEEGKILSPLELCEKAGYKGSNRWYMALKDDDFRQHLFTLGWSGLRERTKGEIQLIDNPDEEWAKDRIDLRRLVKEYPHHLNASYLKIDFSCITNAALKALVKRFFRVRLGFWKPISLTSHMKRMKPFLLELSRQYPQAESFGFLTRQMIEPLIHMPFWTDHNGKKHSISETAKRLMLNSISVMFHYMQRYGWEGAPTCILIYDVIDPVL